MLIKFNLFKIFTIFFIAILAINMPATALDSWQGIVTHVTDGDTLRVRPIGLQGKVYDKKIRINGIDAPESCQLYGVKSTAALKKLLTSKQVTVFGKRFDDYGREVAKVTIKEVDVGGWMVKNGHAWSYHYRHSAGPYRAEEEAAARAHLGLFADTAAVEPRFFRREHGSCHVSKNVSKTMTMSASR